MALKDSDGYEPSLKEGDDVLIISCGLRAMAVVCKAPYKTSTYNGKVIWKVKVLLLGSGAFIEYDMKDVVKKDREQDKIVNWGQYNTYWVPRHLRGEA
jgi:hypothetical protein